MFLMIIRLFMNILNKYNFICSSWGDGVSLGIQTLIIALLVFHFNGDSAKATAFLAGYISILTAAVSGLAPINLLWTCQAMNIPIVLISKVIMLK